MGPYSSFTRPTVRPPFDGHEPTETESAISRWLSPPPPPPPPPARQIHNVAMHHLIHLGSKSKLELECMHAHALAPAWKRKGQETLCYVVYVWMDASHIHITDAAWIINRFHSSSERHCTAHISHTEPAFLKNLQQGCQAKQYRANKYQTTNLKGQHSLLLLLLLKFMCHLLFT